MPASFTSQHHPAVPWPAPVNGAGQRDREVGIKKEELLSKPAERRGPPPAPLNLASSRSKRESVDDDKPYAASVPSSAHSQPTPQIPNASSPASAPLSAPPLRSYSPSVPSQSSHSHRAANSVSNVGVTPPTGPRSSLPPTGPRGHASLGDRKEKWSAEPSWGSIGNIQQQQQQLLLPPQQPPSRAASRESSRDVAREAPPRNEFGGAGHVHPDRIKEIETAAKVSDDKDVPPPQEQTVGNRDFKETPPVAAAPSQPASSVVSSRPGSASSNQGFKTGHSVVPSFPPTAPASSTTTPAPTGPVNDTHSKTPPTGPRNFRPRGDWVSHSFRGAYAPDAKGGPGGGKNIPPAFRGGSRGGIVRGIDRGGRRSGSGRGAMNGERARSRETPSEVDSVDARATDDRSREKDESLSRPDVDMVDAPMSSATTTTANAPSSKSEKDAPVTESQETPQLYPPAKMEDDRMDEDEDEDEDRLTQQDVIAKIADLDHDVGRLKVKLVDLAARKAEHLSAIKQEEEREALATAEQAAAAPPAEEPAGESKPIIKQEPAATLTPAAMSPTSPTPSPSTSSGSPTSPTCSEADSVETESDDLFTASRKSAPADLPYLHDGPAPKPSELEFFRANLEEHAMIKDSIMMELSKQNKEVYEKGNNLKRKFTELHTDWSQKTRDLDRDSRKKKGACEPADVAGVVPVQTAAPGSEPVTRRRGGNVPVGDVVRSEAEMEQVMRDLAEQDAEKDARAKLDGPKEAIVPDMILDDREKLLFLDTNRLLRSNEEILQAYRYDIPADDFNEEERAKFCELYIQFPKQWHKISAGMDNRDTKACIQHYYMTKKSTNYKDLLNKGKRTRRKRGRGGAPQKTRQSALLADLGKGKGAGGTGEEEDGDTEEVTPAPTTERGRPKRAAAPTFGQNADNGVKGDDGEAQTGGRRGGNRESKGDDDGTEKEKTTGTKRTRGGNNGGRERGSKRVRTPAATPASSVPAIPMPQPALAPIVEKKLAKVKEDLGQKESDAVSALAGLSSNTPEIAPAPSTNIVPCTPEIQPQPTPRTATSTPKKDKDRSDRSVAPTTSSYWSVPEQNDFPRLLATYGTDWVAISQRLASKTTVMV